MPTLASLILAAFLVLAFVTSSPAHGGDPAVLHVCIGPLGVMRAVAPQESCPRNHTAVHLGIGSPAAVSVYTVARPVDTVGPLTLGSSISVSCEEGDQVLSGGYVHGGSQPDLQISGSYPGGERSWLVEIQNFSETLSRQVALFARCARLTP
jgi:hypothetical protein